MGGTYNERRDVILWRLGSMRRIHLTCRDARLVRPPQRVFPACPQSLTSSVSRTHAPCVPTGQTEFLDIVSTYIHVSSCVFLATQMNTNALRGIKVRMDIDLRDLRFVVPNKTSFLGQCLYYCHFLSILWCHVFTI